MRGNNGELLAVGAQERIALLLDLVNGVVAIDFDTNRCSNGTVESQNTKFALSLYV